MKKDIEQLNDIKEDLISHIMNIGNYHKVDPEKIYHTTYNIENIFSWITNFYSYNADRSSKKATVLALFDSLGDIDFSILPDFVCESPIEYLMLSELQLTMPERVWEKAFFMPQVSILDGKYRLDIALMHRPAKVIDGVEGIPIVGIECNGEKYHYSNDNVINKTLRRKQEIEDKTNIRIFEFRGKNIYKNCHTLALEFWCYVENEIYPL